VSSFFQLLIGLQFQSVHKISNSGLVWLGLVWFGFELGLGFTKFYTPPGIVHYVLFCCLIYELPNDSKVHPTCHVEKLNTLFTYQCFFFGQKFPFFLTKIMGNYWNLD
jgi:hypothetical protein